MVRSDGQRYCKLITPFNDWTFWDQSAQNVHGISRELLFEKGEAGPKICYELNEFIGDQSLYSDGWVVDLPWLITLYERSEMEMSFRLSSLEIILKESQYSIWDMTKKAVISQLNIDRHRASNDALIVQKTFEQTLLKQTLKIQP